MLSLFSASIEELNKKIAVQKKALAAKDDLIAQVAEQVAREEAEAQHQEQETELALADKFAANPGKLPRSDKANRGDGTSLMRKLLNGLLRRKEEEARQLKEAENNRLLAVQDCRIRNSQWVDERLDLVIDDFIDQMCEVMAVGIATKNPKVANLMSTGNLTIGGRNRFYPLTRAGYRQNRKLMATLEHFNSLCLKRPFSG